MYTRFYGFTTEPFQNTPDLDFLFLVQIIKKR